MLKVLMPGPKDRLDQLTVTINHSLTGNPNQLSEMFGFVGVISINIEADRGGDAGVWSRSQPISAASKATRRSEGMPRRLATGQCRPPRKAVTRWTAALKVAEPSCPLSKALARAVTTACPSAGS